MEGMGGVVRMTVGGRGWGVGYRTGGGGVHTDSVRRALSAIVRGVPLCVEAGMPDCTTVYGCPGVESV